MAVEIRKLFALHEENEFLILLRLREQIIAGLFGESLEVAHRTGVGRRDAQYLSTRHIRQSLLGFQYRQRTIQTARIQLSVKFNNHTVNLKFLVIVQEFYSNMNLVGASQHTLLYFAH